MGVCFMPEYSARHPGIVTRPIEPEVVRDVCLVAVAGQPVSPPTAARGRVLSAGDRLCIMAERLG